MKKPTTKKRSIRKVLVSDDLVSTTQIALNQVEQTNRLHQVQSTLNVLAQNMDSIVTQVNKANHELARRIESLESRCEEIDKLLCKDRIVNQQDPGSSIN